MDPVAFQAMSCISLFVLFFVHFNKSDVTVVHWLAQLPHNKKVLGSVIGSYCAVWRFSPCLRGVIAGYSGPLPQSKDMQVGLIGHSKLPVGLNVIVNGCSSALWWACQQLFWWLGCFFGIKFWEVSGSVLKLICISKDFRCLPPFALTFTCKEEPDKTMSWLDVIEYRTNVEELNVMAVLMLLGLISLVVGSVVFIYLFFFIILASVRYLIWILF